MKKTGLGNRTIESDATRLRVLLNQTATPAGVVDHGSLAGLADDDHSQYVHLSADRTITAQHSFSPPSAMPPFVLGTNAQGQTVTGLQADKLARTVTASTGLSGGGTLTGNISLSVNTAYGFTWSAAHTFSLGLTVAAGQNLLFGADAALTRLAANTIGLGNGDSITSNNFTSGVSGWAIDQAGTAEFQNVLVRGELHASIFVKDLIDAHAGTLMVSKSAGTLADDMTPGSSGTWPMTLKDPPGGGFLFDNSDYARCKTEYVGGIVDLWFTVASRVDNGDGTQSYTCTYASGTRNVTFPAGAPVIDYGVSGQGYVWITADELSTFGHGPNLSIATWSSNPYTASNHALKFRVGNMYGAYGTGTNTRYGFGVGDYSGGNYLSYNAATANQFVLKAGAGSVTLDTNGISITYGTGITNSIRWLNGATEVGAINTYITGDSVLEMKATGTGPKVILNAHGTSSSPILLYVDSGLGRVYTNGPFYATYAILGTEAGTPPANGDLMMSGRVTNSTAIGAVVRDTGNQSIPNAGASGTALTFNTEISDPQGFHSTSSNTSRLTVPTDAGIYAGLYLVVGAAEFAANATGFRSLSILANGSAIVASVTETGPTTASNTRICVSAILTLNEGNYVELTAYQTSGAALNVVAQNQWSPRFSIARIA
jgi:hypothetical protein